MCVCINSEVSLLQVLLVNYLIGKWSGGVAVPASKIIESVIVVLNKTILLYFPKKESAMIPPMIEDVNKNALNE